MKSKNYEKNENKSTITRSTQNFPRGKLCDSFIWITQSNMEHRVGHDWSSLAAAAAAKILII